MKYQKTILTDIDHVVLHHATYFQEWLTNNYCTSYENKNWDEFKNFEEWLGMDTPEANDIIFKFNSSESFSELYPEKDSLVVIPMLKNLGYNFVGITACGDHKNIKKYRDINIEKYFPNIFDEIFYVNNPDDKLDILSSFKPSYWVEDHINNVLLGKGCGHKTFLMDQPYNKNYNLEEGITRVYSWADIFHHIV